MTRKSRRSPAVLPGKSFVDFVQRRRDEICIAFWAAGFLLALALKSPAKDLLGRSPGCLELGAWALLILGVGSRIWAAANMEKNRFDRPSGPYLMVRHPLYLGTLAISFSFFMVLGLPIAGSALWGGLLFGVFLPVIRKEERELLSWFPRAYGGYVKRVPQLVPNLLALPKALSRNLFSMERAGKNFGLRALWFLVLVPGLSSLLVWIQSR